MAFETYEEAKKRLSAQTGKSGIPGSSTTGDSNNNGSAFPSWEEAKRRSQQGQSVYGNAGTSARSPQNGMRQRPDRSAPKTVEPERKTKMGAKKSAKDLLDAQKLSSMTREDLAAETEKRKNERDAERRKAWGLTLGTGGAYAGVQLMKELGKKAGTAIGEAILPKEPSEGIQAAGQAARRAVDAIDKVTPNLYKSAGAANQAYQRAAAANRERTAHTYEELKNNPDFATRSKYDPERREGATDFAYKFVNEDDENISVDWQDDGTREAFRTGLFADENYRSVRRMTDEERAIFNYLYDPKDPSAATEYIRFIQPDLNRRETERLKTDAAAEAMAHPVRSSVRSIMEAPEKVGAFVGMAGDYLSKGEIDPNTWSSQSLHRSSATRNAISEDLAARASKVTNNPVVSAVLEKAAPMVYGTLMSMGDNLMNMAVTGGNETATLLLMGTEAAADAIVTAKDRGLSDDRAFTQGMIAGGIEYITEKIGLDNLFDIILNGGKAGKVILRQMAAEGTEEGASDVLNLAADAIYDVLLGTEESEFKQSMREHMAADGLNEKQAFWEAMKDFGIDLGMDVAGGALSGLGFGVGGMATNRAASAYQSAQIGKELNAADAAQQVIEEGLSADESSNAYKIAAKLQERMNRAQQIREQIEAGVAEGTMDDRTAERMRAQAERLERVSDQALGRQYVRNEQAAEESESASDLLARAAEEMAEGQLSQRTVRQIAKDRAAYHMLDLGEQNGDQMKTRRRQSAVRDALRTAAAEVVDSEQRREADRRAAEQVKSAPADAVDRYMRQATERFILDNETAGERMSRPREAMYMDYLPRNDVRGAVSDGTEAAQAPQPKGQSDSARPRAAVFDGDRVQVAGIDHITDDGQISVRFEDGRTAYLEDVELSDRDAAQVYEAAATLGSEAAAKTFVAYYTGGNATRYATGFLSIYNAARGGASMQQAVRNSLYASSLSDTQRQAAFYAGQNAAAADRAGGDEKGKAGPGVRLLTNAKLSKTQQAQMDALDKAFRALGRTIEVVDRISYTDKDGNVHQSGANAYFDPETNTYRLSLDAVGEAYMYVAVHETVHDAFANNQKGSAALQAVVFKWLNELGQNTDQLVQDQMNLLLQRENVDTLSEDRFFELMQVAREEVVANTVPAILADETTGTQFAERFLNEDADTRSLFQRILDSIMEFLQQAFETLSEQRSWQQMREVSENIDAVTEIRAAYFDALEGVRESAREKSTNTASDDSVRYAIQETDKGKYVQFDRPVIRGTDSTKWGQQVTDYINNEIRHGRDVTVYAENGTPLTITEDTAGKAAFRNMVEVQGTNQRREMTDDEYAVKLRAETHIDELAQVSKGKGNTVPDRKSHAFAREGFNYRVAYFNDPTGYYRLQLSVGKNGRIQTIYNVARIEKTDFPTVGAQGSNRSKTETGNQFSANTMPQTEQNVNRENAENPYSKKDAEYVSLAKAYDAGTISEADERKLRALVDAAAKEAMPNTKILDENGTPLIVYHGTSGQFTVFDRTKGRANMDIQGMFFSPWELDAKGYGEKVGRYYLNITNPASESVGYRTLNHFKGENNAGVKARELLEELSFDGVNNENEEFIAFYPEQIKSADLVTYDNDGKIIPLSQRFDAANRDIRYSLMEFEDGTRFVEIDQEQERFEGRDISEYPRIAKEIIKEKFVGKVIGLENRAFVSGDTRGEYANPRKKVTEEIYRAKMRAAGELDNLLDAGRNFRNEPDGKDGHIHPQVIGGYDYFDTIFKIGDRYFEGVINVENIKKGKRLKDVTKIKDVTKDISNTYGENPKFRFLRTSSMYNMPQNEGNVNKKMKFSLIDTADADVERLQRDNERLQRTVEHLASQFKIIRGFHASDEMLAQLGRKLLKEYGSTYSLDSLRQNLRTMLDYIADADEPSWEDITKLGVGMAKEIVKQSQELDHELYDNYADARAYLKGTRIILSDVQRGEARYMVGSYGNYRGKLFGSVNLVSTDGIQLDQAWQRLAEMNPELFDPDATEGDQVAGLYDAVQQMKPQYINPYGMDIDGVAYDLFLKIFDRYFDMPDVRRAARDAHELAKMQARSKENITMTREDMKKAYDRRLLELRKESIQRRQEAGKKWQEAKEKGDAEAEKKYMTQFRRLQEAYTERLMQQRAAYSVLSEYKKADRAQRIEHEQLVKYRNRIESGAKQLSRWLQAPTEQRHVPEVMRNTVYTFLESLDFSGKSSVRTQYWKDNLQAVKDYMSNADAATVAGETDAYIDIDPEFADQVQQLMQYARGNKSIMEMDAEHLKLLDTIVTKLKAACQNVNTILVDGRRQAIESFAVKAIEKAEAAGMRENNRFTNSALGNLLTAGNIKPIYFFRHIGGPMQQLFDEIRKGQTQYAFHLQEAKDYYESVSERYNAKKWLNKPGDVLKITTARGDTFELTRDEALALYAISNREARNQSTTAAKHLQAGGFVFNRDVKVTDKKGKEKSVRYGTPHPLNAQDMMKIKLWLTDEQRAYADELVRYMSTDLAALGNEVSMKTMGVKRFTEQYYFPYKSSRDFIASAPGKMNAQVSRLMNKGFTKQTVAFANNPIVLQGFTEVFGGHVNDMLMYNAMAIPQENMLRVYNWTAGIDERVTSTSVKVALQNAYGEHAKGYVDTFLADLNGDIVADPREQIGTKLLSRFKRGAVMANLSVAIQQPSAIVRAAALIDPRYFFGKPRTGSYEEAKMYAGTAIIKDVGGFDTATGRGAAQWVTELKSNKVIDRYFMEYVDKIGGYLPNKMDEITWGAIWEACKRETAEKTGLKGEELLKATGERFDEVIELTQVYDSVITRSQMMRSKSGIVQMATSFMAEPTVTFNMLYDMLTNKEAKTKLKAARTLPALIGSVLFNSLLKSVVYAMRDDDDQPFIEKYIESVVGSLTGEPFDDWGKMKWAGYLLTSELSPASMIPYIKDIVAIFGGYDVKRTDMSVIVDLQRAIKILGKENVSVAVKIDTLAGAIGNLCGVPYRNASRDVKAVYKTADDIIRKDQKVTARGVRNALIEAVGADNSIKTNVQALYAASRKGNQAQMKKAIDEISALYDDKVKQLIRAGQSKEAAEKAAKTSIQSACTKILRELYREARTAGERTQIKQLALRILIGRRQLYSGYDFDKKWK